MGTVTVPTALSCLSGAHHRPTSLGGQGPVQVRKEPLAGRLVNELLAGRGGVRPGTGQGAERGRLGPKPPRVSHRCLPAWRGARGAGPRGAQTGRGSDHRFAAGPRGPSLVGASPPWRATTEPPGRAGPRAEVLKSPATLLCRSRSDCEECVVCSEEVRDTGRTGPKGCVPACPDRPANLASQTAAHSVTSQEMTAGSGTMPKPMR